MNTEVKYKVFEQGDAVFPVDETLLNNITYEQKELLEEMMKSGYYVDGIDVSRFLRTDLSINLERLELATILAVTALEANSPNEDVTLRLRGLDTYYQSRGISGNENKEREERTFLLGFISSIASDASRRDTLVVKFVS